MPSFLHRIAHAIKYGPAFFDDSLDDDDDYDDPTPTED